MSRLGDQDLHLFNEGTHRRLYSCLGAHPGHDGTWFGVWAPNARGVSVIGDFNAWDSERDWLQPRGISGIWEGTIAAARPGHQYKFRILPREGPEILKADPFAFQAAMPPDTPSVIWSGDHTWGDDHWMAERQKRLWGTDPVAIYEVHLGSWRRVPEEENRWLTYREIAAPLADYVTARGFTHVEFLPLTEHPFYGSWGYQPLCLYAPTARYGLPEDLMYLIDYLHQRGIGVILDWVPSHFPSDWHGLGAFDGTHLYEHADPRQGFHPDWLSLIYNFSRFEVRSFLLSNAAFWLERFHVDGLRVDAVASMLYLDYSRRESDWIPNEYGGRENIGAIHFLRDLNRFVAAEFAGAITIAEESTAWPMVTRPTEIGGLGFSLKWDMGWMHDTLKYFQTDPIYRRYHHHQLTFRSLYANSEAFVLALSHDEVVHGKGSLLGRLPGDPWQKFANLRLLLAWMYATPGKKSLFMGGEFGQWREWNHDASLDWHLLDHEPHQGALRLVDDLNRMYRTEGALHLQELAREGTAWIDCNDVESSVVSLVRWDPAYAAPVICVANFTPVPRYDYEVGVPRAGHWRELLNTDATIYGGSGLGNLGGVHTRDEPLHAHPWRLRLTVPPLGALFLTPEVPAVG